MQASGKEIKIIDKGASYEQYKNQIQKIHYQEVKPDKKYQKSVSPKLNQPLI